MLSGIDTKGLLQSVDLAVEMVRNGDLLSSVPDYLDLMPTSRISSPYPAGASGYRLFRICSMALWTDRFHFSSTTSAGSMEVIPSPYKNFF